MMTYKLIDLGISSFMNSDVIQNPSPTEALNFIAQNILVFEKTVFKAVYNLIDKLDTILEPNDGKWIQNYYHNAVAVNVSDTQIKFYVRNAIVLQCICEILSIYKYVYLEQGLDPLEIPNLPPYTDIEEDDIPRFYLTDVDAKYQQFIKDHS